MDLQMADHLSSFRSQLDCHQTPHPLAPYSAGDILSHHRVSFSSGTVALQNYVFPLFVYLVIFDLFL